MRWRILFPGLCAVLALAATAGAQFQTGNVLSADGRLYQNGPAFDGWTPPARGASQAAEPTYGAPGGAGTPAAPEGGGGRGRGGRRGGAPQP